MSVRVLRPRDTEDPGRVNVRLMLVATLIPMLAPRLLAAALALLAAASPARACPLCDTATGVRVRAGVFDADFGANVVYTLLPFLVAFAGVTLVHFAPAARPRRPPRD